MVAFDYKRQVWVDGEEGRVLRIRQLHEELDIIESPKGAEYARMIGKDLQAMRHHILSQLGSI